MAQWEKERSEQLALKEKERLKEQIALGERERRKQQRPLSEERRRAPAEQRQQQPAPAPSATESRPQSRRQLPGSSAPWTLFARRTRGAAQERTERGGGRA